MVLVKKLKSFNLLNAEKIKFANFTEKRFLDKIILIILKVKVFETLPNIA